MRFPFSLDRAQTLYFSGEGADLYSAEFRNGRYLFFQSVREGSDPNRSVYWMEAGSLETLRANAVRHGRVR